MRDYQGVPALLNLCGESVSESIRESALDFLFQYSELGRKNQDSLRRWNAINILWKLLLARVSTRSVLRLIISMCKFSTKIPFAMIKLILLQIHPIKSHSKLQESFQL